MNRQYPIYTIEAECQDCYKCVRHCPVKAIRVLEGRASVLPELCIACGRCVSVCPAKAKRVRDDLGRTRQLLQRRKNVYVSLAPSWVSEFEDVTPSQIITVLKRLGFSGVSETALGAQEVSAAVSRQLGQSDAGLVLSSACPVCVSYVQKYQPELAEKITPLLSPLLTHAHMLRDHFGEDTGVVFIGPCIAKKLEADQHPELLDAALTFDDMRQWLKEEGISLTDESDSAADFLLETAQEGSLYPIEGGMIKTIRGYKNTGNAEFVTISGMSSLAASLDGLDPTQLGAAVFVEGLACEGGCVNGPCARDTNPLLGRMRVNRSVTLPKESVVRTCTTDIAQTFRREFLPQVTVEHDDLKTMLKRIGKTTPDDELNCGGCGYDTCRAFATALLQKKAEPAMCVSNMRRLAMRKANALLRCMPSGGVIVDRNLTVIESNEPFAQMMGEDTVLAYDASLNLRGAQLARLLPFAELFRTAFRTGQDIHRDHMIVGDRMLNVMIFTIEPGQTVGAIMEDVTSAEIHREKIARKAREVIARNISTVQDIACSLGEHMADTEILLRSIASDYADHTPSLDPEEQ